MGGRNILNECTFDPAIPLPVIFPKTIITKAYNELQTRVSISALFIIVKKMDGLNHWLEKL